MNGISLHINEHGENKVIHQKLVFRSFFYILKGCYQRAGNSSPSRTESTAYSRPCMQTREGYLLLPGL